jgi:hypothetical protein
VVEEVPGNWEWAKDGEAEERPCEVRESLRQVEKARRSEKAKVPEEGTQFSILYTSMYSPAEAATPRA